MSRHQVEIQACAAGIFVHHDRIYLAAVCCTSDRTWLRAPESVQTWPVERSRHWPADRKLAMWTRRYIASYSCTHVAIVLTASSNQEWHQDEQNVYFHIERATRQCKTVAIVRPDELRNTGLPYDRWWVIELAQHRMAARAATLILLADGVVLPEGWPTPLSPREIELLDMCAPLPADVRQAPNQQEDNQPPEKK